MPAREDLCVSIGQDERWYNHVDNSDLHVAESVVGMLVMGKPVAQLLWHTCVGEAN